MAIVKLKTPHTLDRSKPPKSGKPKDINFPGFFETKTDNGITVLVIQDNRLPLVTARFVFKSGAYNDFFRKNKFGLSSLTSELLTKGTQSRSATEIAEEVDYHGATLGSGSNYDGTFVSAYSLKKYFGNIFDIITEVILEPSFKEEEIKRVKLQRLNSLLSMIDDGEYLADKVFCRKVYGNSPYAFPPEGEKNTVKSIRREDILDHYNSVFTPENMVVAFVGNISPDEALLKLNQNFSGWKKKTPPVKKAGKISLQDSCKVYLTEKKGAVQSSLKIGHLGINRNNPDFIPVSIMNTLLGGFFTSRINKNLREVNGYTYGARSNFHCYKHSGDFSVVTEVKTDITGDTVDEILKEINIIKSKPVSSTELQDVKNYISGNFPFQLETPNEIASKVINLKLFDLEDDFYTSYLSKVNSLTKEDIKTAAEKYLHPDKMTFSIAGDTKHLRDKMSRFGKVEFMKDIF